MNADYTRLYLRDSSGNYFVKYNDGTNDRFITFKPYESIIHDNLTTAVTIPQRFTVLDKASLYSRLSGTATATSAISAGESTLTDSAGDFSNVSAGDSIHNTTDGSDGIVLSKTSSTALITALFGGTLNQWTSGNAYVIQPQGRYQLILEPPPSTAGHTVTVEYIQRPDPVFSSYGTYRFGLQFMEPLIEYAAFKYKYRDREPNFGDYWFKHFDRICRQNQYNMNQSLRRTGLAVNLRNRV